MPALELQVARDATVGHTSVDRRDHLNPPRPVLRRQRPLDTRPVRMCHAHKPPAAQHRLTPSIVPETKLPDHHRRAHVELMAVAEQLDVRQPDRVCTLDPQLEHQPVGKVDEILIEDRQAPKDRRLTVVDPVHIGAGVMHTVRILPLRRPARAQVAVTGRGQRLAKPFLDWIKALISERETIHRSRSIAPLAVAPVRVLAAVWVLRAPVVWGSHASPVPAP